MNWFLCWSWAPIDARLEVQVRMSITVTKEEFLAILVKSRFRDARPVVSFRSNMSYCSG